jgi:hypothetical protein
LYYGFGVITVDVLPAPGEINGPSGGILKIRDSISVVTFHCSPMAGGAAANQRVVAVVPPATIPFVIITGDAPMEAQLEYVTGCPGRDVTVLREKLNVNFTLVAFAGGFTAVASP